MSLNNINNTGSKTITNENPDIGTINQTNYITVNAPSITSLCPLSNNSSTADAICTRVNGQANERWSLQYSGQMRWGSGNAAQDTFLYRSGVSTLTLSTSSLGSNTGTLRLGNLVTDAMTCNGNANVIGTLTMIGDIQFASGYKIKNETMTTDTDPFVELREELDTVPRFTLYANRMRFTNGTDTGGTSELWIGKNSSDGALNIGYTEALGQVQADGKIATATVQATIVNATTVSATTVNTNTVSATGGTLGFGLNALNNIGSISSGPITAYGLTDSSFAFQSRTQGEPETSFAVSGQGELQWSSGFIAKDTFLYRNGTTQLVLSSSSLGSPAGSIKTDILYANNLYSNSGNLNLRPASNTVALQNSGGYSPFQFDLTNYAIGIAPDGFSPDTYVQRGSGGSLTLGTTSGAVNGTLSTGTFNSNGTSIGNVALNTNISGDTQARFVLDMDGQHGWSSGSANRDTWLYRSAANTLTLSTSTRGSATGTFSAGTVQGQFVKVRYGASSFYNVPLVLYNQRVGVSAGAGTNTVATITIPSGLVGSQGDQINLIIEGSGNGATTTRTVQITVNGSSAEGFNLVSGAGNMWRVNYQITRATSTTTVDIVGVYTHFTTTSTFGNALKACTSLSSAGSIVVQTISDTANEIVVRHIRAEFIPVQA